MDRLWKQALEAVAAGQPAVLVTVVDATGSVPGHVGTRMLVTGAGTAGTVGGGTAEHRMVERARVMPRSAELQAFAHDGTAGSICAGAQTLALVPLADPDRAPLESLVETLEAGRSGALRLAPGGLAFAPGEHVPTAFDRAAGTWEYRETLGDLDTLVIVGGGHVALALSRVMATLPFRIVVLDNRPDLPTMDANVWADEKRVIDYDDVADHVPTGDRTWVTIMTQGHFYDRDVLVRLVESDLRYLGMLGSSSKVRDLYGRLERGGVPRERLERVSLPGGPAHPQPHPGGDRHLHRRPDHPAAQRAITRSRSRSTSRTDAAPARSSRCSSFTTRSVWPRFSVSWQKVRGARAPRPAPAGLRRGCPDESEAPPGFRHCEPRRGEAIPCVVPLPPGIASPGSAGLAMRGITESASSPSGQSRQRQ